MIHRLRTSITGKLFIFICFSLLITLLPLFIVVHNALKKFGDYAYDTNARQITHISNASLSALATAQAQKYDQVFLRVKTSASLLAQRASEIYADLDLYGNAPLEPIPLELNNFNQIFFTPPSFPIITAFWGEPRISPAIEQEINALSHLGPFLKEARKLTQEIIASHIITQSGIGRYYTLDPRAKNQCFDLPHPREFDLRHGEPFRIFTGPESRNHRAQWTDPYKDDVIDGFMMTAVAPIVDASGRFQGIAGMDIPLISIAPDLAQQEFSQSLGQGNILFGFLMDKNGRLIAFPERYFDLFGLKIDLNRFKSSQDILTLNLTQAKNPEIQAAVPHLLGSHKSLFKIHIDSDPYIFATSRLSETGWHLVLVSREEDQLSSVHQTRTALGKSLSQVSGYYLKYSALILLIAILFIFCAVKIIIQPIKQLTDLTQKVSEGELTRISPIRRQDEIGALAQAFNQMVEKLILSEKNEKAYATSLEIQTDQLKRLNEHLVFSEEMERKTIASDLHDSIAQTLALGISKIKNMHIPETPVSQEDLEEIQEVLEQAIREIRSLIYKLSPPILDDFDIDIALGFLVEETNAQHQTRFTYTNNLENPVDLNPALKLTLYRATDELITNILKHAKTQRAEFEIWTMDGQICIRVEDEGVGMDIKQTKDLQGFGFGLYSISERMENFGGRLDIISEPGKGTKITLTAPIPPQERGN